MSLLSWLKNLFRQRPKLTLVPDQELYPLWYKIAEKEMGVRELAIGENKRILEYHSFTRLNASTDETPWCASFVCWCLEKANQRSPRNAWAKSFLNWGVILDIPSPGCIAIFTRGSGGHVGFFVSSDKNYVTILGGNQGDRVSIAKYKKENLVGYRWPKV